MDTRTIGSLLSPLILTNNRVDTLGKGAMHVSLLDFVVQEPWQSHQTPHRTLTGCEPSRDVDGGLPVLDEANRSAWSSRRSPSYSACLEEAFLDWIH
jgi:hypothetical protein